MAYKLNFSNSKARLTKVIAKNLNQEKEKMKIITISKGGYWIDKSALLCCPAGSTARN